MKPSPVFRILFALSVTGIANAAMAQAPGGPLPTAESRAAASAIPQVPAPGAAPGATPAAPRPAAEPAKPEVLDPAAEAERKKVEAALREKKEAARKKAELDNRCVIKQAMSDAEIAKCR